jgi:hypothetical protein
MSKITNFLLFSVLSTSALLSACGSSGSISIPATGTQNVEPDPGMYRTISAAEEAANELGCMGTHEHLMNGMTWYMPCEDHSEWMKLTDSDHDHNNSDAHHKDSDETEDSHDHSDSHKNEGDHSHHHNE